METAAHAVCYFMVYSFIGWVYESVLCSITERRLVNRGFLNGPVCPIYGAGAMLVIVLFGGTPMGYLALFLAGGMVTCTLEYLTSYGMEKLLHARYWDYSDRRFQINGRVCAEGFLVFGALSVALVKWIHPAVQRLAGRFSAGTLEIAAGILLVLFLTDLIYTVVHVLQLNGRLAEIQRVMEECQEQVKVRREASKTRWEESKTRWEEWRQGRFQVRRLSAAFPKLKPLGRREAWEHLKEQMKKKRRTAKSERPEHK